MNKNFTVVLFSYDLSSELKLNSEFKTVLEGLDWMFQISGEKFPQTTCLKIYDPSMPVDEAIKLAKNEIKSIVKKVRENGFKSFNVEKYFFLGHKTEMADAEFGENLLGDA